MHLIDQSLRGLLHVGDELVCHVVLVGLVDVRDLPDKLDVASREDLEPICHSSQQQQRIENLKVALLVGLSP